MSKRLRDLWSVLRALATDDAYERYLEHHAKRTRESRRCHGASSISESSSASGREFRAAAETYTVNPCFGVSAASQALARRCEDRVADCRRHQCDVPARPCRRASRCC